MSVLTITNKQIYQDEKDKLQGIHNKNKTELGGLSLRRDEIAAEQTKATNEMNATNAMNVNLSHATQALKSIKKNVSEFNSHCELLRISIHQNNQALTSLRDRIQFDIATATATAAAAAAKKSEEDAELSVIKDTIAKKIADINREYVESQTDDTTELDELMSSDLKDVNMPEDKPITEETKAMIRTYNGEKNEFLTDKLARIYAIKQKYNTQKQAHQQKLIDNIAILNRLSGSNDIKEIGVKLSDILNDKNPNPIDEIKKEIVQLKQDLETKQGSFIDRKKAIDEAIQIDMKLSELTAELVKLEDTNEGNIFKTVKTVSGRRYDTIDIDNSPIQAVITSELTKARELSDPTRKSAIILRVEVYIQRFDRDIMDIENKLNEIKTESPNSKKIIEGLKERIVLLKAAKSRYQGQVEQIKTLATSARSGSPSPNPSRSPSPNPVAAAKAEDTQDVYEGPDEMSTSLMTKKLNGRNRPLFQGVPQNKKQRYIYVPPTINKTDPIYLIDLDEATSGGGKIIQHGGADPPGILPTNAVIYQLAPTYDDNIMLLASLDTPQHVLNDDELIRNLTKKATVVDPSVYPKIQRGLISSDDKNLLAIARRAVYKSSILKLMGILDLKVERKQGLKTYTDMYKDLWEFANPNDAARVINRLAPKKTQESEIMVQPSEISQIVGWTERKNNNPNLDNYFNVFTKCGRVQSTFLDDVIKRKGKDGKLKSDKAVAYRFKLNWIILIAFYCLQNPSSNIKLKYENVGELIINTYDTLLGWITADTYEGMFFKNSNPVLPKSIITYSDGVKKKIEADIVGDTTFTPLKTKIIEKICESTMANDAKNHDDDPEEEKDLDFFPDTDSDGGSSDWTSDDGDTSSRSSLSSARLGPHARRNVVPVAKDTVFSRVPTKPSSQSSGPEVLLDLSKLQDTTQGWLSDAIKAGDDGRTRLMRQRIPDIHPVGPRTPSPEDPEVLPSQIRPLTSRPSSSQPPSGFLSERRSYLVDPYNPSRKPHPTSNLPGQFNKQNPEPNITARPPTVAATRPSPSRKRLGTATLSNRVGGNKRTRKHRTAPAPAPAPATRRRRRRDVIQPLPKKGDKYTRRRARI
jgi:hypothetical protein